MIQLEDIDTAAQCMSDALAEEKTAVAAEESRKLSSLRAARVLMQSEPRLAAAVLTAMGRSRGGRVLSRLQPEFAAETIWALDEVDRAQLLRQVPADNLPPLLTAMPAEDRETLTALLDADTRQYLDRVADIPEDAAGRIMSPHFVAVNGRRTVKETLDSLLSAPPEVERAPYIYILDDAHRAIGVVSIKDLLRGGSHKPVAEIMNPTLITLDVLDPARDAALLLRNRRFTQLPVVDEAGKLLGVLTFDDAMRVLSRDVPGNFTPAMAVAAEESFFTPPAKAVKGRLPWMAANVFLNMGAVAVISGFEDAILAVPVLAAFIPMITDMGGNVGIQSLSVSIRSLAMGEARPRDYKKAVRKEFFIGIFNGLCLGALFAVIAFFLRGSPALGLLAGVALATNVLVAGVVGGLLPFLIRAMGKDPAMMTGPVLTTITDITGVGLYLGLATLFMGHLLGG